MGLVMDEAIGPDIVCFSGRNRMQEPSSRRRRARFGRRTGTLLSEAPCGALRFFVQRRGSGLRCDLNRRVGMVSGRSTEDLARGREILARGRPPTRAITMGGTSRAAWVFHFRPVWAPSPLNEGWGRTPSDTAVHRRLQILACRRSTKAGAKAPATLGTLR